MTMKRSSKLRLIVAVASAGAALAAAGMVTVSAQDVAAGDAVNGKRLYLADGCFECHGRSGQGGAMNYPTPALAQLELPVESFIAFLRDAPNDMPSFSVKVLSDKDAADIYAFLHALPGRKPAKDFPLLNQ
jgi:mono/diheme cytochrome c family protein